MLSKADRRCHEVQCEGMLHSDKVQANLSSFRVPSQKTCSHMLKAGNTTMNRSEVIILLSLIIVMPASSGWQFRCPGTGLPAVFWPLTLEKGDIREDTSTCCIKLIPESWHAGFSAGDKFRSSTRNDSLQITVAEIRVLLTGITSCLSARNFLTVVI